jgi:hypothetical protein
MRDFYRDSPTLTGTGWLSFSIDFGFGKTEIFFIRGLDERGQISDGAGGQITSDRHCRA